MFRDFGPVGCLEMARCEALELTHGSSASGIPKHGGTQDHQMKWKNTERVSGFWPCAVWRMCSVSAFSAARSLLKVPKSRNIQTTRCGGKRFFEQNCRGIVCAAADEFLKRIPDKYGNLKTHLKTDCEQGIDPCTKDLTRYVGECCDIEVLCQILMGKTQLNESAITAAQACCEMDPPNPNNQKR